jgi:hypothetical protein
LRRERQRVRAIKSADQRERELENAFRRRRDLPQ